MYVHAAEQQLLAKWVNTQFSFRVRGAFAAALFIIFLGPPKRPAVLATIGMLVCGCGMQSNVYQRLPSSAMWATKMR